jgi:hypothetical protein
MHHLVSLGKRLAYQASKVLAIQNTIRLSPEKAHVRPMIFTNDYRQKIVAFVGGREVEIASSKELGLVGVAWDRERNLIGKWFNATTGKTFADLGIDLKAADGKPILKVYYRRSTIDI